MLTEFVLISCIKPDVRKTLNINISGYVNIIIIKIITSQQYMKRSYMHLTASENWLD